MEKICTVCGISKPLEDFSLEPHKKYGREARCRQCRTIIAREYRRNNREKSRIYQAHWRAKNKKRIQEYRRNHKGRYTYPEIRSRYYAKIHTRISYRLDAAMKTSIWESLRGNKNGRKWETLVGYTLKELKSHLEKLFQSGMNWVNYGKWHIDHIQPKSSFNFTTYNDKEFKECWSLNNLQPLWAVDNIRKSDKTA